MYLLIAACNFRVSDEYNIQYLLCTYCCCCKADNRLWDLLRKDFQEKIDKCRGSSIEELDNETSQSWGHHIPHGTLKNNFQLKTI